MSDDLEQLRGLGDNVTDSNTARGNARAALFTRIAAAAPPGAAPRRRRLQLRVSGGLLATLGAVHVALTVVAIVVLAGSGRLPAPRARSPQRHNRWYASSLR